VKKLIALTAIVAWQLVTAASSVGQQRPGETQASRNQNSSNRTTAARKQTTAPAKKSGTVRPANHVVMQDGGEVIHEPSVFDEGCTSCGSSSCDSGAECGSCTVGGYGDLCYQNCGRMYISLPAHGWVHAEGLTWYQSGMRLPPLVTTSPTGTARSAAGVLQRTTTSVLFGNDEESLTDASGGFRIRFGTWLGSVPRLGIEGEYVGLSDKSESFSDSSTGATGSRILARPFFNTLTGVEDAELIAFPNVVRGSIRVDLANSLHGAAFRFRRQLCCNTGCGFSDWTCQTVPVSSRIDFTLGYRFWQLDESLTINEQLTELTTAGAATTNTFNITDRFRTSNKFNGAELGVIWQGRRGWWSLDTLMRVGIGNVNQVVTINGSSTITENGATTNHNAGFLTQRTNIGTYERDKFTMVPEFGATVGYQLTRRLRATLGYSLIYWGNVVRPGDQIDLDVNPNLLPPENVPFSGALRPQFQFVQTDYWVHGLSYGAEFRW
jgi:Putative beta barrel porin-7 (BBP7)